MAEVLAIIPARGGSKGIPRKNIRSFAGYPLITFSLAAAFKAEMVTRVIVSTDDEEIAEVARAYGAETPFLRPVELALDKTTDLPVFQHALAWLDEHERYHPEAVIHLRPTSPVRPLTCVDDATRLLLSHPGATSVRGVVESGQNPYKMWRIDSRSGQLVPLLKLPNLDEAYNAPRQVLPSTYWQTGHIDVIRPETIVAGSMSGGVILPLVLDQRYSIDLDTPADWEHAEWLVLGKYPRGTPEALEMVWPEEKE